MFSNSSNWNICPFNARQSPQQFVPKYFPLLNPYVLYLSIAAFVWKCAVSVRISLKALYSDVSNLFDIASATWYGLLPRATVSVRVFLKSVINLSLSSHMRSEKFFPSSVQHCLIILCGSSPAGLTNALLITSLGKYSAMVCCAILYVSKIACSVITSSFCPIFLPRELK